MKKIIILLLTFSLLLTTSCVPGETPTTGTTETTESNTTESNTTDTTNTTPTPLNQFHIKNIEDYYEVLESADVDFLSKGYSQQFIHHDDFNGCGQLTNFSFVEYETRLNYSYTFNNGLVKISIWQYKVYQEYLSSSFFKSKFYCLEKNLIDISSDNLLSCFNLPAESEELIPAMTPAPDYTEDKFYYLRPDIEYRYDYKTGKLIEIYAAFGGTLKISIEIRSDSDYSDNHLIVALANKQTAIATFETLIKQSLPPATE